jgi:hypothetical protein
MFLGTYQNIQSILRKFEYCTLEVCIELTEEIEETEKYIYKYGSGLRPPKWILGELYLLRQHYIYVYIHIQVRLISRGFLGYLIF